MKKIIHITLLLVFALSVIPTKAQDKKMLEYWEDVDFNDTTLISSKTMSDKLIDFFFSFTDGDEQRFDSLSVAGPSFV